MCALFGWLDCGKKLSHKLLKKFTQELANAAEERGTDASGISYVQNDKIKIYKKAKPAHKMKFTFPEGTTAVMGHTRLTTQGNQKFNFNNHPFYGKTDKEFAFAHNGVLYNDDTLRKEKPLPKTCIETDSYVAVQLLEKQGKLNFDSLKSMAEDVQGNFTFTILDQYNTLYFVKGSSPMFLIYFENLGLFAYASTESIMSKAMRKSGMNRYKYSRIQLNEGDILSINKNGKTDVSEFETFSYQYTLGYSNDTCLHANAGKKLIIGEDVMFSINIRVLCGDGHSIFNTKTGKNTNSIPQELDDQHNSLVIGNHVWVGINSTILTGSIIGDGSIIGANSLVKSIFPNNCAIGGNPAKLVKKRYSME